jgi:hypothetical protein
VAILTARTGRPLPPCGTVDRNATDKFWPTRIGNKDVLLIEEAAERFKYSCYCYFLIGGKVIRKSPGSLRIGYVTGFVPAEIGLGQQIQQIKS